MKLGFIVSILFSISLAHAKLIMIIRHGEKINDDIGTLSDIGQARANCLVEVFGNNGTYTTPQKIFAQSTINKTSTRPRDTVIPLAKSLGLDVDLTYQSDNTEGIAKAALGSPESVVLISWSKDNIDNIAKKLGIKKVPDWDSENFDDVWIITDGLQSYIQQPVEKVISDDTYGGNKGLVMFVGKENIVQCMKKYVPNYVPTSDSTTIHVNITTILISILSILFILAIIFSIF